MISEFKIEGARMETESEAQKKKVNTVIYKILCIIVSPFTMGLSTYKCNLDAKTIEPPDCCIDQGACRGCGWLWKPGNRINCSLNIIKSEYYKAWGKSGRKISALVEKNN
jgi:hypothetical protein